jgi:hypothetical protein
MTYIRFQVEEVFQGQNLTWKAPTGKGIHMEKLNNGLVDEDSNFIVPLVVIGMVVVVILLIAGLFMPTTDWIF